MRVNEEMQYRFKKIIYISLEHYKKYKKYKKYKYIERISVYILVYKYIQEYRLHV